MGIFDQMLVNMGQMGFFQTLFPFLLALAIFYAVLMWALKERLGKGPIGLISIVLSFFVMYFAQTYLNLGAMLALASGWTLAIACMILFIIIIFGLFGIKLEEIKNKWVEVIIALVVIYIIISFIWGGMPSVFMNIPWLGNYNDVWTIVLFLVIIAIAWHFLSREEKPKEEEGAKKK